MKTLSIFLALINSLMAGLILVYSLSPTDLGQAASWWSVSKIGAASCVILIAGITWLGSTRSPNPTLMSFCSLVLVALGAATSVWTFHLALVTGDIEYYMFVYGSSLIIQGMSFLFGFVSDSRSFNSL